MANRLLIFKQKGWGIVKIATLLDKNKTTAGVAKSPAAGEGAKINQTFSNTLDTAEKEQTQRQLSEMVDKIKAAGNRLKAGTTEAAIREYKDAIKNYLSFVLKNYYKLRHDRSINYSTVYTRVEVINQEVDQLTKKLLEQQRDCIDIVAEVDKITGLILDVYS